MNKLVHFGELWCWMQCNYKNIMYRRHFQIVLMHSISWKVFSWRFQNYYQFCWTLSYKRKIVCRNVRPLASTNVETEVKQDDYMEKINKYKSIIYYFLTSDTLNFWTKNLRWRSTYSYCYRDFVFWRIVGHFWSRGTSLVTWDIFGHVGQLWSRGTSLVTWDIFGHVVLCRHAFT